MELLERDDAVERLRACVAAAEEGVGRVVLVAGEAGIGKTSLMREVAKGRAPRPVWWESCDALQVPNPLAPLHDIARSANARFAPLLDGAVKASVLFGEVMRELQALGPVLIVVEDAHWADDSTLDFIRFLGRRIDRTQVVLAVTFRQDELPAAHPLRTVIGDLPATLTTRIDLAPLSPEAVAELARFARLAAKARAVVQLAAIVPGRVERWLVDEMLAPEAADIEAGIAPARGDHDRHQAVLAHRAPDMLHARNVRCEGLPQRRLRVGHNRSVMKTLFGSAP